MIRSDQSHLPVLARTHPGMTGKNNEDRYAVTAYRLKSNHATPALLAVLSDGIGGHRAGEVAAEIAVNTISQSIAGSTGGDPTRILQQAIQEASQKIFAQSQTETSRRGMGATCAVAWVIGSRLYSANVGDSRLYLMRENTIQQLSTDHTWIQEALERGFIQPEEIRGHPNAHVIRRYLGSPTPPKVDLRLRLDSAESDSQSEANQGLPLLPGDRLLLCSDGLTDLVENQEILDTFQTFPVSEAVQSLINLANQRGGHDNITLIAIEVPSVRAPVGVPWTRRIFSLGCLGAVLAALLLAGLAIGGLWYYQNHSGIVSTATGAPSASAQPLTSSPQASTTVQATPLPVEIFGTAVSTGTPTRSPLLLPPGAPTLTPWPTNTNRPTNTATATPTQTATP